MAASTPLVKGTLDMLIRARSRWEPTHGAGVAEWMRLVTNGALDLEEGTLYPALRRMEKRGLIRRIGMGRVQEAAPGPVLPAHRLGAPMVL